MEEDKGESKTVGNGRENTTKYRKGTVPCEKGWKQALHSLFQILILRYLNTSRQCFTVDKGFAYNNPTVISILETRSLKSINVWLMVTQQVHQKQGLKPVFCLFIVLLLHLRIY